MRWSISALLLLSFVACGRGGPLQKPGAAGTAGNGGESDGPAKPHCTFKGFADPVSYTPTKAPYALRVADLTGDGHLDILVAEEANWEPSLELFTNTGKGTFKQAALPIAIEPNWRNLVAADLDGDGIVDLASQSNGVQGIDLNLGDGRLSLNFGIGPGRFASQPVSVPSPQNDGFLTVGDFDGDGRPDIAFAGFDYQETGRFVGDNGGLSLPAPRPTDFALTVFHNAGQGSFVPTASYANPTFLSSLVTGDFDGDGHLDVAELASTTACMLGVFYNTGDGHFADEATFGPNPDWGGYGLGVADFDGDGIDDLATTTILHPNASNQAVVIEVRRGARDRSFTLATTNITSLPDVSQIAIGDFDGDGRPDLALVLAPAGRGGGSPPVPVAVYANQGDGSFAAPALYDLQGKSEPLTNAIVAGDLNGDGVSDIAVATTGRFDPYPVAVHVLLSQCD